MRDFRDAKTMAQTLRDSLTAKAVTISHSESLELVSKMLGVADWNTLSAVLKAGGDRPRSTTQPNGSTSHPAIPIRDFVPFPGMTFPLFIGREKTIHALEAAYARRQDIVLAVQKAFDVDEPGSDDVHLVGVLAKPLEAVRLPDTTLKVLTQVERRVAIRRFTGESGAFQADIAELGETAVSGAQPLIQAARQRFDTYAAKRELRVHPATRAAIDQDDDPGRIADTIASYLVLPLRDKQVLLGTVDPVARLEKINALLDSAAAPPHSAELAQTIGLALAHAKRRRHAQATLEHLLLALTDDRDAATVMQGCSVDLAVLREKLDHYVETTFDKRSETTVEPRSTAAFQRVVQSAAMQAWENGDKVVTGIGCLVQLFAEWKSPAAQQLAAQRMTQKGALDFIKRDAVKPR